MATITGLSFNIEPYEEMYKSFFFETTNINESKLYINGHWMVPYIDAIFRWVGTLLGCHCNS
jgi:hypothetical protein